ncbi:Chaperone protein DnaJ [Bienertia sinuspersici]
MGPLVLTQLTSDLRVIVGAAIVKLVMDQNPMANPFLRCPSCNGSGWVSCFCSRWSDGDVGCHTCRGSGRAACPKCGGSD